MRRPRATPGPSATSDSPPFRRILPETLLASILIPAAALMAGGYAIDLIGGAIAPVPMGIAAVVVFGSAWVMVRGRTMAAADDGERLATLLTGAIVAGSLTYFLWLASPSQLPVTIGPDIAHHLVLIRLIEQTHHLVHGTALNPYLAEMAVYTPGAHILAALVAAWTRVDPVRVVHPVAAAFTAVTLGIVYALAYRSSEGSRRAAWQACAAPLLALIPASYTIGAFMHFFYFAQVVAGAFALAMLLGAIAVQRLGRRDALAWCAVSGMGVVLAWPVWIVPPALALIAVAASRDDRRVALTLVGAALLPAAVLVVLHTVRHPAAGEILATSGAVVAPSVAVFGAAFMVCALAGAVLAAATRRGGVVLAFTFAVLLEAGGLYVVSRAAGSGSPYLPFKMMFLLVPPAAVLGSLALARLSDLAVSRVPRAGWIAAVVPMLVGGLLLPGRIPVRRQQGSITEPALAAGEWARDHLPTACLDYFSTYWLTGFWLHFDVLGNPRASDRGKEETFEFRDSVGKWIEGRGLPYGFVEDFDRIPRDARVEMVPIRRFGRAAIVRNLRPAACTETPPSLWTIAGAHER